MGRIFIRSYQGYSISSNDLSLFSKELEVTSQRGVSASNGKRIEAAKILGLGRNTITRKIKS